MFLENMLPIITFCLIVKKSLPKFIRREIALYAEPKIAFLTDNVCTFEYSIHKFIQNENISEMLEKCVQHDSLNVFLKLYKTPNSLLWKNECGIVFRDKLVYDAVYTGPRIFSYLIKAHFNYICLLIECEMDVNFVKLALETRPDRRAYILRKIYNRYRTSYVKKFITKTDLDDMFEFVSLGLDVKFMKFLLNEGATIKNGSFLLHRILTLLDSPFDEDYNLQVVIDIIDLLIKKGVKINKINIYYEADQPDRTMGLVRILINNKIDLNCITSERARDILLNKHRGDSYSYVDICLAIAFCDYVMFRHVVSHTSVSLEQFLNSASDIKKYNYLKQII